MLSMLRNASKGWISKTLLLLLVLSFAVWGIAGQVGGIGAGGAIVTAGGTKVSANEYFLAYNRQLNIIQQRIGQRITPEQARLFGIENQVASQLAGGAVLDEQTRMMKLGLSEENLADLIASDEAFQGLNGSFDRGQFRSVLRNVGMTEAAYIESRKKAAQRQQIAEALSDGMTVPNTFMSALAQFQGQTRDVTFIEIDESSLGDISAPDDATLAKYFDENKSAYRAPEYRAVKIVRLTAEEIADPSSVTDETVRAEYDNNRARYSTAEKRTVQQLVFSDKDAANIARERILAGASFDAEVEALGRKLDDVTLGTFEKNAVPDQTIGDAAFALKSTTDISPVIDGVFGPILVRVSEILLESVEPFQNVSVQIRSDLALLEAQDLVLKVHDLYEDARASGKTMEEAAAEQKLEVKSVATLDRLGLDKDGTTVELGAESAEIIRAVFSAELNSENPPLSAGRDGFIWYEVTEIIADRDQAIEEVRARVITDWIAAEKTKLLDAEAERIVIALRAGTDTNSIATEKQYRVDNRFGLVRGTDDTEFGQSGVAQIFSVGPSAIGFTVAPSGNRRLVFKLNSITNPLGGAETLTTQQSDNVQTAMRGDMLDLIIGRLRAEIPVSINQSAIQQIIANGNLAGGGR